MERYAVRVQHLEQRIEFRLTEYASSSLVVVAKNPKLAFVGLK
jgi:hypothetical protein